MSLLSKINFRRILIVFLVQISLFLGLALGSGNNNQAVAEVLNRTAPETLDAPMNEVDYESVKANRREQQAKMSEQATEKAEAEDETISEKLNLQELTPGEEK